MAYSFPLSVAQFMGILPVSLMTFDLPEAVETAETGGGEVLRAALGSRLWQGQITLGRMTEDEEGDVVAMLDVLRRASGSFMVYDKRRAWPRSDPNGAILGAATPVINEIAVSTREIALSGLPAGYELKRGDMLSFSYSSNPTLYALHRIAAPATADGAGLTPLFEVSPNIRAGAATSTAVSLVKPVCKAVIVPNSFEPGERRKTITSGMKFRWMQTLR